jgi:hypothetical protein
VDTRVKPLWGRRRPRRRPSEHDEQEDAAHLPGAL